MRKIKYIFLIIVAVSLSISAFSQSKPKNGSYIPTMLKINDEKMFEGITDKHCRFSIQDNTIVMSIKDPYKPNFENWFTIKIYARDDSQINTYYCKITMKDVKEPVDGVIYFGFDEKDTNKCQGLSIMTEAIKLIAVF